ncbi:MAG: tetratricopeptide repeat protein [Hyphomicrobiaceae bacterium]|nr:tetratricopeptide repeat protein [Hyphomicrobiaceae bacterium]
MARSPFVTIAARRGGIAAALTLAVLSGGCAGGATGSLPDLLAASPPPDAGAGSQTAEAQPQTELERATDYWGKAFAKSPNDATAGLSYARNLKAMGRKQQALAVLQQVAAFHSDNREVASEYGRLALDLDQVSVAEKLLSVADDPARPDWRVISARGTALAKQGKYRESIPFFERALALSHNHPSLLNNLALAQAMVGEPDKAEELLRQASAAGGGTARVRQNLALVLGLQGKYDEASKVASQDQPSSVATADTAVLRKMVKLDPVMSQPNATAVAAAKPAQPLRGTAVAETATAGWEPKVADVAAARSPGLRGSSR